MQGPVRCCKLVRALSGERRPTFYSLPHEAKEHGAVILLLPPTPQELRPLLSADIKEQSKTVPKLERGKLDQGKTTLDPEGNVAKATSLRQLEAKLQNHAP